MGLFVCCVSDTHLESRTMPQMPSTQSPVFLNVNSFSRLVSQQCFQNIPLGNKGKTNMIHLKKYPRIRPREGRWRKLSSLVLYLAKFFPIKLREDSLSLFIQGKNRDICKGKICIWMHILLYVKLNAMPDNVHSCITENKCRAVFWFVCACPHIVLGKPYPD